MAAKKNHTGAEDEAPVKTSTNSAEERYIELRSERRTIEAELAAIDTLLCAAINGGDLESLDRLSVRKSELPRLFIAASTAEMTARQALFSVEDKRNLERLRAAEDRRDELQTALVKMREKHKEEIAALTVELQNAVTEVGATYSAIQSTRDQSANSDAGFKRSMAKLTGV